MKARLFSKTGTLAGSEYVIDAQAVIGRDNQCDIVLYPHTISSRHARIFVHPEHNAFFIEDLNSSNGTKLDKTAILEPTRLDRLHVITLAKDIDLIFQIVSDQWKPAPSKPTAQVESRTEFQEGIVLPGNLQDVTGADPGMHTSIGQQFDALPNIPDADDTALGPPSQAPLATPKYKLIVQTANTEPRTYPIKKEEIIIGRSSACDVTVQDDFISGKHAAIRIDREKVFIRDLGSSNKTYIDNEAITEEVRMNPGTPARLGPKTRLVIE